MKRKAIFIYGIVIYLVTMAAYFVGFIGFVGDFFSTRTVDKGVVGPVWTAVLIDLGLISLFGLAHSVMARRKFKQWWTKIVPPAAERSTYLLQATALLLLLMWQWRPIPTVVWQIDSSAGRALMWGLFWLGWIMVAVTSFLINHAELLGLQQIYANLRGRKIPAPTFKTPFLYKIVRHPMQLGHVLAFWATPRMTVGHLVLAVGMTLYILVGIAFEERDLKRYYGDAYQQYQQQTPKLIPLPRINNAGRRSAPQVQSEA